MEDVKPSKSDLNVLILDYLTAEGYPTAAERFSKEADLNPAQQQDSVLLRNRIQHDIHLGSIQNAIEAINELNPQILDSDTSLHFALLRLQLIELIRESSLTPGGNIGPALTFATTQLAPKAPSDPAFLEDLERTMALLIFPPDQLEPQLAELLHPDLRKKVADRVNEAILASQGQRRNAAIRNLVKLRSWAENASKDAKITLPEHLDLALDGDVPVADRARKSRSVKSIPRMIVAPRHSDPDVIRIAVSVPVKVQQQVPKPANPGSKRSPVKYCSRFDSYVLSSLPVKDLRTMLRLPRTAPFVSAHNAALLRTRAPQQLPSARGRAIQYASQASRGPHALRRRPQVVGALRNPNWRLLSHTPIRSEPAKQVLKTRSRTLNFVYRTAAWLGISVTVASAGIIGFFLYDASTYREDLSQRDIQISDLALNPKRGGPKNLPIAEVLMDDEDDADMERQQNKPRLVVLGGGWGSVAMIKELRVEDYHVTLISPTNYFLFTPMLPSATVGTLELRSLAEPIRRIVSNIKGHFIKARAEGVEFSEKLVEVSQVGADGTRSHFYIPYDKLVIGVGSTTNPYGVKGLDNCNFLKDLDDARKIKHKILDNLEAASLPTTSEEERKRLLSFVVCGGGPTGVEFAAELFDLLNEDLTQYFPRLIRNEVSVHLIQSRGHILNTYDEAVSTYAEDRFSRDQVQVLTNSRVKEVRPDKILFTQKDEQGETITKELPMGFCLWSTGVSQTDFSKGVAEKLGDNQTNKHALETDSHLRLIGAPLGDVYAIGDCATVQNNVADNLVSFLNNLAYEKGKDPKTMQIEFGEWIQVGRRIRRQFPQASEHLKRLDKLFEAYDKDQSGTLDFGEMRELLMQIDKTLTSLPATAQRAHQQGQYLAHKFNKMARAAPGLTMNEVRDGDLDDAVYKSFQYHHLGSLAYLGNSAVFDLGGGWHALGGLWAVYAWRSVYFAQSVSVRTRLLLAMDWAKRALFGRDMMTF
ncbi:hypothetical protein O988_05203 [Pseudogymnoascus sp. VKM F-3808]|nr:hypothetical protein O988_05203 [Pseudogymnoascus sp. VKM F-3808]